MHTLMLHGHATSAFIFKAQTQQFRSKLDKSYTFDFVDAPIPSELPLSLKRVFKTAYTWLSSSSDDRTNVSSIRQTASWLLSYMEKNGPYDCVCCFSLSAAIILTLILDNRFSEKPRQKLPFKSVIFMNASIEYSVFEAHGLQITDEARDFKKRAERILYDKANDLSNLANIMTLKSRGTADMWKDTSVLLHDAKVLPEREDCFGLDVTAFPADLLSGEGDDDDDLPTMHIYGDKDPIYSSGIQVAYLCGKGKDGTDMLNHQGGHDVPRNPKIALEVAGLFRKMNRRLEEGGM
ncbi:serine hydrolase-domain-containing protein [Poronia punctata]|nr:serine hydrolase-domain-containing protein [Poronia punctata]